MKELNIQELTTALKTWFLPGEVFEVRVLEALTKRWNTREHTEAGYFDYEHIDAVAEGLQNMLSYKGVYVSLNPLNPAVLGRAKYVFKSDKLIGAKDEEVLCRRWLPIDCDAKRVSGVSSSDEEHEKAIAKAKEIREGMRSLGWPEPIVLDSGNGAQLLYKIDLPAADDGLVKRVLEALLPCSDEAVDIDQTVFNPARIWRLPGAWNCKGDECPEQTRVHRQSRILELPEQLKCVSREQLEAVAGTPALVATHEPISTGSFDIHSFVARHFPEAKAQAYNGGTKWVLDVCPFNADHNDRSAVITQGADGKIGFKCHHNGCVGKNWHDLRALLEPKYEPVETPVQFDITQLSARAKTAPETTSAPVQSAPSVQPPITRVEVPEWQKVTSQDIEEKVLKGTILGRIMEILSRATKPALPIEFTLPKALVLLGAALTQRVEHPVSPDDQGILLSRFFVDTAGGQACNMYCMLAAPSGTGKDIGGLDEKVAAKCGWYLGSAGSSEGLADRYILKGNGILKISEMQPYLDVKKWQHGAAVFLTEGFSKGFFVQCLSTRSKETKERSTLYCYPNILANIQPATFEKIVNQIDIDNGFLGRFLYIKAPPFRCHPGRFDTREAIKELQTLLEFFSMKEGKMTPPEDYSEALQEQMSEGEPEFMQSHIARLCNEYYPRLAVMLSVTDNAVTQGTEVVMTDEVWEKARLLVYWFYTNALKLFSRINEDDEKTLRREKLINRVLALAKRLDKGSGFTKRDVSLNGVYNTVAQERSLALEELVDRGELIKEGLVYHVVNVG